MKKICKILVMIVALFVVAGCDNMKASPTKRVEELLEKYKSKDDSVIKQLEDVVANAGTMTDEQKSIYRELMEKQYENLNYKIKEERIDGNNATIITEIDVLDYGKAISASEMYLSTSPSELIDEETGTVNTLKYMDYKINQMKDIKDRVTYTINFNLNKKDNEWLVEELNDIDRLKIHGLYY